MKAILTVLVLLAFHLGWADVAVVVGINAYKDRNQLQGAVNDAKAIRQCLVEGKFDVSRYLVDEKATQTAIVGALRSVQSTIGPTERFVFYYAGHGLQRKRVLVPIDYNGSSVPGIGVDDLYQEIRKIRDRCRSATVILDCCFSGTFAKSQYRARSYVEPGVKDSPTYRIQKPDTQEHVAAGYGLSGGPRPICYAVASHADQPAYEPDILQKGEHYGVFTFFLLPHLKKLLGAQPETWQTISHSVNAKIDRYFSRVKLQQTSMVTPEYLPLVPFEPLLPNSPAPHAVPATVYSLIQSERPDDIALELGASPQKAEFLVGEPVVLSVQTKRPGYLVVVACDPEPRIFWPRDRRIETACKEKPGSVDLRPAGIESQFFERGSDHRLVAYLFHEKAAAEAILRSLDTTSTPIEVLEARKIALTNAPYATASRTFRVTSELPGSVRMGDWGRVWRRLREQPPLFDWINGALQWTLEDIEVTDRLAEDPGSLEALQDRLQALLNAFVFRDSLWEQDQVPDGIGSPPPVELMRSETPSHQVRARRADYLAGLLGRAP